MSGLMSMAPPAAPTAPAAPTGQPQAQGTPHFQQPVQPPAPGVGAAPQVQPPQFQPQQQPMAQPQFQPPQPTGAPQQYAQPYAQPQPQQPFFSSFTEAQQQAAPQTLDPSALAQQVAQHMAAAQQQPVANQFAVPVGDADVSQWEQHKPALSRLIAEEINKHVAPHFGSVTERVDSIDSLRSDLAGLRSQTYESSLRAAVPDLDAVANTPEFQQYRNTVLPGGVTVDALMRSAHQNQNSGAMIDVFRGFQQAGAQQQNPMQPMSASNGFNTQAQQFAQPHVAPAAGLYPGAAPQQGIDPTAAADVLDRYSRGQATREEYDAVEAALQHAQTHG